MSEQPKGLLADLLKTTPLAGLNITPNLMQRDIVFEITPEQLKNAILSAPGSTLDQRARDSITVEFHEGKMVIKIRLF